MNNSKLTPEQVAEIQEKYANGMTQRALAAEYGVSQSLIQKRCGGPYRTYKRDYIKYKGLRDYLKENAISARKFAGKCGISYVSIYYILTGRNEPKKNSIDRILKASGLTYEQAFGDKDE